MLLRILYLFISFWFFLLLISNDFLTEPTVLNTVLSFGGTTRERLRKPLRRLVQIHRQIQNTLCKSWINASSPLKYLLHSYTSWSNFPDHSSPINWITHPTYPSQGRSLHTGAWTKHTLTHPSPSSLDILCKMTHHSATEGMYNL